MVDLLKLEIGVGAAQVDQAANKLDGLAKSARNAEGATSKLAATFVKLVAAAVTLDAAVSITKKFISSTIEAEAAQTKLNAVLKATGGSAGLTAAQLTDMATGLQRVTSYGDEAILSAETMLLTFRRIGGDVFPRATEAALDLATHLGIDLDSAAKMVGKSLDDPTKGLAALTKAGITFSPVQAALIKGFVESGQAAKAQGLILDQIEGKVGGMARAMRGTLGGALTALDEAFGDLFESTGSGSDNLRRSIERIISLFQDPQFMGAVQGFGSMLFDVIAEIGKIVETTWKELEGFNNFIQGAMRGVNGFNDLVQGALNGPESMSTEGIQARIAANLKAIAEIRKQWDLAETSAQKGTFSNRAANLISENTSLGKVLDGRPETSPATRGALGVGLGGGIGGGGGGGGFGPTADQLAAAEKEAKAYDKLVTSAQARVASLTAEADGMGLTNRQALSLTNTQELLNEAVKAGIDLSAIDVETGETRLQKLMQVSDQLTDAQIKLQSLHEKLADRSPWEVMIAEIQRLQELGLGFGDFTKSAGEAIEEMVSKYAGAATGIIGQAQKLSDALFDADRQRIENSGLTGDRLANALEAQGRKQFEINKQIAIANAIVAGGEAVVKSFNWGTTLGGFPGGAIAATVAVAVLKQEIREIEARPYDDQVPKPKAAPATPSFKVTSKDAFVLAPLVVEGV